MANETNTFTVEELFEQSLAELLINHGWEKEIIMNPTEEDLVKNWADIIYNNNLCNENKLSVDFIPKT